MSEERYYRGAVLHRRYKTGEPHGWWLLPEGPLEEHPDKCWVPSLQVAKQEIDQHRQRGGRCLMEDNGRWLGVLPETKQAVDSAFDRAMLQGFSAWCATRYHRPHEPCTTGTCPCDCHGLRAPEGA